MTQSVSTKQLLEWKKTDDTKAPKVENNNQTKTMENIVLNLKLMRGMRPG